MCSKPDSVVSRRRSVIEHPAAVGSRDYALVGLTSTKLEGHGGLDSPKREDVLLILAEIKRSGVLVVPVRFHHRFHDRAGGILKALHPVAVALFADDLSLDPRDGTLDL